MTRRARKCVWIIVLLLGLGAAVGLVLYALKQNIDLYYTPTQILDNQTVAEAHCRLGGLVKKGSVHYDDTRGSVSFVLTDEKHSVVVDYRGILPDLFREEQGIVASGHWDNKNQHFIADEVLAKHDENYRPPAT